MVTRSYKNVNFFSWLRDGPFGNLGRFLDPGGSPRVESLRALELAELIPSIFRAWTVFVQVGSVGCWARRNNVKGSVLHSATFPLVSSSAHKPNSCSFEACRWGHRWGQTVEKSSIEA